MSVSLKTIVLLGILEVILLTMLLLWFFRYEKNQENASLRSLPQGGLSAFETIQ